MRGRSGFYRGPDGKERIWYSAADIEATMVEVLRKADLLPSEVNPTVDIERFIQSLGVHMDQHAELELNVLGMTRFYADRQPRILINRDLTGAIDDDQTPPGIRGRWRATMAHEASHVVLHRILFEVNRNQQSLFKVQAAPPKQLMRCLKHDVLFRGNGPGDWREVQANMGMAALLMPEGLFSRLAGQMAKELGFSREMLTVGSQATARLSSSLAVAFEVSKQAASIRLETVGLVSSSKQPWLIGSGQAG